jgi:hypothetical protein
LNHSALIEELNGDLGRRQISGWTARFKTLRFVVTIAERLVFREAAAAERDYGSAREAVFFSFRIVDRKIPFNANWSVIVYCDFS